MKSRDYKAFIVEGEAREPQIIRSLVQVHFKHCNFEILTLPAGQNMYMLWQKMKEDEFETDLIEVLRESSTETAEKLWDLTRDDFSEEFLFFDYDGHQDNLAFKNYGSDAVDEMLQNFSNETENEKLILWRKHYGILSRASAERKGTAAACRISPAVTNSGLRINDYI